MTKEAGTKAFRPLSHPAPFYTRHYINITYKVLKHNSGIVCNIILTIYSYRNNVMACMKIDNYLIDNKNRKGRESLAVLYLLAG